MNLDKQFSFLPVQDQTAYSFYKRQLAAFWTMEEIDMSKDRADFEKLTEDGQAYVKAILSFFAASDGIVNENLNVNFLELFEDPHMRAAYTVQQMMETIHSETYSTLINVLIPDIQEQSHLLDGLQYKKSIKAKAKLCQRMAETYISPVHRLIFYTFVEGIMFCSSFAGIYWLKETGLMAGLTFSNELIARDEQTHTEFGIHAAKTLAGSNWEAYRGATEEMLHEVTELEIQFAKECLPNPVLGMSSAMMEKYIRYVANEMWRKLDFKEGKRALKPNPFSFMERLALPVKTNFFEAKVGSYQRAGVLDNDKSFSTLDEF